MLIVTVRVITDVQVTMPVRTMLLEEVNARLHIKSYCIFKSRFKLHEIDFRWESLCKHIVILYSLVWTEETSQCMRDINKCNTIRLDVHLSRSGNPFTTLKWHQDAHKVPSKCHEGNQYFKNSVSWWIVGSVQHCVRGDWYFHLDFPTTINMPTF